MLAVDVTNVAVDTVTRTLAVELASIRVHAVSPGTPDTGAYDALGDQAKAQLFARARRPARHAASGNAEDIAGAVLFALTTPSTIGVSLGIDGREPLL